MFSFLSWMAADAMAQSSTGTVLGVVTDQSGAAIPGADVALVSTTTGVKHPAQSLEAGNFQFLFVPPDVYQLTVTKAGFSTSTVNNVVVRVNETNTQNVQLNLGAVSQEVTVTSQVAKVDATTASLGAITGYSQITILPVLGRSFMALATLSSGTVADYPGSQSIAFGGGRLLAVGISGSSDHSTVNLIDGVPTKSPEYGGIGYQLPMEMIDEFNIQRGFYSAKYPGAGVVNVVSRSGKNEIHGVAWETFRNNVLDARSFFDAGIPPLRQNHFGGAFGGAIKKDKLFYFGNVQFVRDVVGYTERGSVPTASELGGNLSDIPGISIHNVLTGQPFTGGVIPPGQIDSFATKYMALGSRILPVPNLPGPIGTINRSIQSNLRQTDNFFDVRVDYNRSEKDNFFVRFGYGNSSIIQPALTAYTTSTPYNARNGVISWTHLFSPTLINEYHFGYDRVNNRPVQPYGPGVGSENFNQETGLVGANTYSPCDGPVGVGISGIGSFGTFLCDITLSNNYINNDSIAYLRGKHSFQFGADLTRYQITDPIFNGQPGSFSYTGQYSGNAWADFLLGYAENANALTKTAIPYRRSWNWGLFAEDKYQLTRNFTINLGLRWELPQPAYDKENNLAAFVPGAGFAPNTPYTFEWAGATTATTIDGQPVSPPRYGRPIVRTNYKDFAPRVGLAWLPFGDPKWAVRASYGVFFQTLLFNEEVFNSLGFPVVSPYSQTGTSSVPVSPEGQFGSAGPSLGGYLLSEDPDRSDPYVQQWTLSIQRQLPGSALLSVAYLGNRGTHLFVRTQYNVAHLGTTPLADRLPFPSLGAILNDKSIGQSTYNALQVDLEKRYSHNLSFRLGYTYANAMDDSQFTAENGEMLPWDVQHGWCRSGYNLKHNFVFSHTYLLPFGAGQRYLSSATGALNKLVSGWQSVGILSARNGWGYTIGAIGLSNTNTEFFGGARPNRTCSGRLNNPSINEWFDTSCFSVAPANTWGNAGYNFLDAPGYFDWDLSAVKDTKLTEKVTLQFRAEFFNAFNRANFGFPNTYVTEPVSSNPLLGTINSAGAGREIQAVFRFMW
jgi:hypothetical protein